ncbi:cyclic nucleotide-gated ion channel 1 [Quercus suber]|uniref:Cyclic nucleotide-gated ion channel 1 n=1 Tax=Quercus suber TaxID=58331 RepID=A0AAW0IYQ8_QUESU
MSWRLRSAIEWVAQFVGLATVRWMWMGFGKCGWVPAGVVALVGGSGGLFVFDGLQFGGIVIVGCCDYKKLLKSGKPELNTNARKIAKKYLWPRLIFDILAILPIPQVVIPTIFSEMRSTKTSNKMKLLNTIVLFQYVPRVSQIYLSWKKLTRNDKKFDRIILVKASLNFILYILAGHVSLVKE